MQKKTALVTGVTGQDGAYLSQLLLDRGYAVHGIVRRASLPTSERIAHLKSNPDLFLHDGDLGDGTSLARLVTETRPDEIYNLAAQSHVKVSFESPEYTADVDALGPLRLLEAIRLAGLTQKTRFYQASTSELFGKVRETPQRETTPFHPRSPYGVAKLYAYWITVNYREAYGLHASNGILFNHEGPTRGVEFVTRKITTGVAALAKGPAEPLALGNLDAKRDWGHARDFVEAMWLMLQQSIPDDYVIATGETHTVREFVELAFNETGRTVAWSGSGVDEVGRDAKSGQPLVRIEPRYFRPAEVDLLLGDPTKAKLNLGWAPRTRFADLVREMVAADLARL